MIYSSKNKEKRSVDVLDGALNIINKKYDNNITFKRYDVLSDNRVRFTLTVKQSALSGGRVSQEGHRIASACWHVHGDFFDAVFEINADARIYSAGRWISPEGGNWIDRNIGSVIQPFYYSESCKCERG